jgi:hypothetical protein
MARVKSTCIGYDYNEDGSYARPKEVFRLGTRAGDLAAETGRTRAHIRLNVTGSGLLQVIRDGAILCQFVIPAEPRNRSRGQGR